MNCPNCQSPDEHRVIWSLRNLAVSFWNLVFYASQLAIGWIFAPGWPLTRKCMRCGFRFAGPRPFAPDFDECARCGYNLTGNVSGMCSECGWKLPRRYREHREKVDRDTSTVDRTEPPKDS